MRSEQHYREDFLRQLDMESCPVTPDEQTVFNNRFYVRHDSHWTCPTHHAISLTILPIYKALQTNTVPDWVKSDSKLKATYNRVLHDYRRRLKLSANPRMVRSEPGTPFTTPEQVKVFREELAKKTDQLKVEKLEKEVEKKRAIIKELEDEARESKKLAEQLKVDGEKKEKQAWQLLNRLKVQGEEKEAIKQQLVEQMRFNAEAIGSQIQLYNQLRMKQEENQQLLKGLAYNEHQIILRQLQLHESAGFRNLSAMQETKFQSQLEEKEAVNQKLADNKQLRELFADRKLRQQPEEEESNKKISDLEQELADLRNMSAAQAMTLHLYETILRDKDTIIQRDQQQLKHLQKQKCQLFHLFYYLYRILGSNSSKLKKAILYVLQIFFYYTFLPLYKIKYCLQFSLLAFLAMLCWFLI